MRTLFKRTLTLATLGLALVVSSAAQAQDFDGAAWVTLERAAGVIGDGVDGGNEDDVVGDGTHGAAFVWSDATYLYFRVRVDAKPTLNNGTFRNSGWGCAVDTNGTLSNYEFLAELNGTVANGPGNAADAVQWRHNTVQTVGAENATEPAETVVGEWARATHARALVAPGSNFGGDEDWFVDLAIPWATIRTGGNGAPAVAAGTPMRFICGVSSNGTHFGSDFTNVGNTLTASWSYPYVCGDSGCALDRDGDGVPDAVEVGFGTSPTNVDSDGDGIPDNVELTAGGGALGPYTGPDSDGDGTIDALDSDSDNDCRTDLLEGAAGYRDPALPNADASANCAGATPFCDTTTGSCVACDGNNGDATNAACPFASAPACQLAGALAGRCTQCKADVLGLCLSVAAPACESTTGACAACNGDNAAAVTAPCPYAAFPACQAAGALAGQCTQCSATNASQCANPTPSCDGAAGACAACNGDRGGGATRACPAVDAPYCVLAGAGAGACGKCATNSDCGAGHTGPTCDVATGACVDKDSDGDGLNDSVELLLGTDPFKRDTDGDGIDDLTEVTPQGGGATTKVDTDGDGIIDALDLDSDGDGIPDKEETAADIDGDGVPNFRDKDDDGDGIDTATEIADTRAANVSDDVDGDGVKNWYDSDADGDGKYDGYEGRGDEDGDGIPDYLDATKSLPDAGSGLTPPPAPGGGGDAGAPGAAPTPEQGVVEGAGLLCSTGRGAGSTTALASLLGLAVAAVVRRRRR
ncbi:MAG: hypothetical protein R3B36_35405 [Polyangiaceae bacterium]